MDRFSGGRSTTRQGVNLKGKSVLGACACGAKFQVERPGSYTCRECGARIVVRRRVPKGRAMKIQGSIPWNALEPEVRQAVQRARVEGRVGIGPGDALATITKALGIKPCAGCKWREKALNSVGWKGFAVVASSFSAGLLVGLMILL